MSWLRTWWPDFVCAAIGCTRPKGAAKFMFIHVCGRCGRPSFIKAKR